MFSSLSALFFISVCFLILITAAWLIMATNPIQSVLLLVLVFLQTALLFVMLGAEFLAVLLITVYIGAIAILFLFVVMLLNLRIVELYSSLQYHIPVGIFMGFLFFMVLALICWQEFKSFDLWASISNDYFASWSQFVFFESNLHSLGELFYNYYLDIFLIITFLLLVAMIGVIVLAVDFDYREDIKQNDLVFEEQLRSSLYDENII